MKRLLALLAAALLAAPASADTLFVAAAGTEGPSGPGTRLVVGHISSAGDDVRNLLHGSPFVGRPVALALSRDGRQVAVATEAPDRLHVIDRVANREISWAELSGRPAAVTFAAAGLRVAVAIDTRVLIHDPISGEEVASRDLRHAVTALGESPLVRSIAGPHGGSELVEGEILAAGPGTLDVLHPLSGAVDESIPAPSDGTMQVIRDGRAFLRQGSGHVTIVDLDTFGVTDLRVDAPIARTWSVTADGRRVVSVERDDMFVHEMATGLLMRTVSRLDEMDAVLAVDDGLTALGAADDGALLGEHLVKVALGPGQAWLVDTFPASLIVGMASTEDAHGDILDSIHGLASEGSVQAVSGKLDARLDVAVSSRASQSSVDSLSSSVSSRASQASVDALATAIGTKASESSVDAVAADVGTRSSQASVDALATDVGTRSSQSSVDALTADVGAVATDVDAVAGDLTGVATDVDAVAGDVTALSSDVADRATQSSVDALSADVAAANARLDASMSSRASQSSLDLLASDESARADAAAADHREILAAMGAPDRRQIEAALAAGELQPLFMLPGGPDADPSGPGGECPSLPSAGHPSIDGAGLLETVRCVARRAIDGLRAIGEDPRRAETDFAQAEAARLDTPPRYRDAAVGYAAAVQSAMRGR